MICPYHLEKGDPKIYLPSYLLLKPVKLKLWPDPEHTDHENEMITSKNEYVNPKTVNTFKKKCYMIWTVDQWSK